MALESATYINGLVATNPTSADNANQGDNHIRLIKSAVKATFPNLTGAVTATHTALNTAATDVGAATSANTLSAIVRRDSSGNFAAGTITAGLTGNVTGNLTGNVTGNVAGNLTGNVTGNVVGDVTGDLTGDVTGNVTGNLTGNVTGALTGNASTASKWATARTITLAGDATGSVSIDGSANATLTVAVGDDSHNHIIGNVDGLQTALDGKASLTGSYSDPTWITGLAGSKISGNISGNAANVTGTVAVANGGTGATSPADARSALSAAKSGANTDITSIAGLTTALSIAQGGTGATTASTALSALGGVGITASQLSGNGYIKLSNGLYLMWGSFFAFGNTITTFSYSTISASISLTSFSRAVISGWEGGYDDNDNNPAVYTCGTTSFGVKNGGNAGTTCFFLAVGY